MQDVSKTISNRIADLSDGDLWAQQISRAALCKNASFLILF